MAALSVELPEDIVAIVCAMLHDDPYLGMFADETCKTDKGSKALQGATVKAVGSLVELTLPDSKWSGSSIKLMAASEGAALDWTKRIEAAIAGTPQPPPWAPTPPAATA